MRCRGNELMRYGAMIPVMLLVAELAACSGRDEDVSSTDPDSKPEHVWQEQVETLDKARQLELDVLEAHKQRADEMQKQEQ